MRPSTLSRGYAARTVAAGVAMLIGMTAFTARADQRLRDASPSVDAAVQRLLDALKTKDKEALRRLRVTETEYKEIIIPGNVDPGMPAQQFPDQLSDYAWGIINGKSIYVEANILHDFGGHDYKIKDVLYRKGIKQYAGFKAYKQLVLTLEDEKGAKRQLSTGTVVDVDGQFKFVSFVRD
jgi:hypothetical protein